jgi:signal transduction histidine kinase
MSVCSIRFLLPKGAGDGAGLDLSASQALIKEHGETMTVQSELGHGTTSVMWPPITAVSP